MKIVEYKDGSWALEKRTWYGSRKHYAFKHDKWISYDAATVRRDITRKNSYDDILKEYIKLNNIKYKPHFKVVQKFKPSI